MNQVISVTKKINDNRFNYIGKSRLDGTFLYEVDFDVLDIRNENPVKFKYKLLDPQLTEMSIVPWDYKNTINVYDPCGYKEYYK
jgi:hypothetical protein